MRLDDRDPILLTPGPLTTSLRDQAGDAARLGLVGRRLQRRHRARARAAARRSCTATARTSACRCRAAARSRSRRRSARWCRATATCWCSTTAPTASASAKSAQMMGRAARRRSTTPRTSRSTAADVDARARARTRRSRTSALVHCETGTGVLNPLPEIAAVVRAPRQGPDRRRDELVRRAADRRAQDAVRRAGRRLAASASKARPAWASCSSRKAVLERLRRQLARRWRWTCTTSGSTWRRPTQWRFTPPTHVVAALARGARRSSSPKAASRRALRALRATTARRWSTGMAALGFEPFLEPRDPGADHRHLPCAGRPGATTSRRFYDACARSRLHPLSGQADAGRDVPRRLHRRDRRGREPGAVDAIADTCRRWASGRRRRRRWPERVRRIRKD